MYRSWTGLVVVNVVLLQLCACTETNQEPRAVPSSLLTQEEAAVSGFLQAEDPEGKLLFYALKTLPARGTIRLNPANGNVSYQPAKDVYGEDRFAFAVFDGKHWSSPAEVTIQIENVNDPPTVYPVPDLTNSSETEFVHHLVSVFDPDVEQPWLSVTADDQTMADASIDQHGLLSIRALRPGTTAITVSASDGEYESSVAFDFSATELSKTKKLSPENPELGALQIRNTSEKAVDFILTHNGFPTFETLEDVANHVQMLPEEFPGENFGRKLWRFLRDSTYHEASVSTRRWSNDSWVTLNSLGWGICSNLAAAYVDIARAGNYEARVWGLYGHVVSEIMIDGKWQMYDTDLGVYYMTEDFQVASVEELAANPSLIVEPVWTLFSRSLFPLPYSQLIADFYSSTENNGVDEWWVSHETPSSRIVLPPGAQLTYPGRWTENPVGIVDGGITYEVGHYRQALMELPDGWTGTVPLPWLLWDIRGAGQVGIGSLLYEVGSIALTERIRNADKPVTSLDVFSASELQLVFFVNAVTYDVRPENEIILRGLDVWALDADTVMLSNETTGAASLPEALGKPRHEQGEEPVL